MRQFGLVVLGALICSGCVTSRTRYQPHGYSGGYSEEQDEKSKVWTSRFSGNAYTRGDTAAAFSRFRAAEICKEQGFKVSRVLAVQDKSQSQTVQRTSNYTYQAPTYVRGNVTASTRSYGGYSRTRGSYDATVTGGDQYGGSQTWNETYHYPIVDTYFTCANSIYQANIEAIDISKEDMKPFVKDLLGAVQVKTLPADSPNVGILEVGDLITKVDGKRVTNFFEFMSAIDAAKNPGAVKFSVVREGRPLMLTGKLKDTTEAYLQAEQEVAGSVCEARDLSQRPMCAVRNLANSTKD